MNIFEKIFEIMSEYEKLLNSKINTNNNSNDINDSYDINDNNPFNDDDFFKYIFQNIHIEKKTEDIKNKENNINQKNIFIENNNDSNINNFLNSFHNSFNNNNENNSNENNNNYDKINKDENEEDKMNKDENENEEDFKIDNNETDEDKFINDFIKKIYKKIILKCHPDKNGDKDLFLKCKEYYDDRFLIGILYIGYKIKFKLPLLNQIIIDKILFEIRIIQEKIINLKLFLKKNIDR